jgi:hypothetical protein
MYSTSNRKFKYDKNASNFAVTINGSMSLTSYFHINDTETTHSCQFQFEFGTQ